MLAHCYKNHVHLPNVEPMSVITGRVYDIKPTLASAVEESE